MKIKKLILKNFRGYKAETHIKLDNSLCALVGKNDVGKSTILEALDIFFNEGRGSTKIDSNDVSLIDAEISDIRPKNILDNLNTKPSDITIGVQFSESLDYKIIIDETSETSLNEELLLDAENCLTIIKQFSNGRLRKTFLLAKHPNIEEKALILHKNAELKNLASSIGVDTVEVNLSNNTELRRAIREHLQNSLEIKLGFIPMDATETKNIWDPLKVYLPQFYLFRADRKNSDQDEEVKDPLGVVVKEVFHQEAIVELLNKIDDIVRKQVSKLGNKTIQELHRIDPALATSLTPSIPDVASLKWADVYKAVSICGDNEIPINKRGSGVRRLVLLGFLLARIKSAETSEVEASRSNVIYAIEEPETALHSDLQKLLINALKNRADQGVQVLITTHSSVILKELEYDQIRLILKGNSNRGTHIVNLAENSLPYKSLNEIAFLALGEATEEYHNELYGLLQNIATSENPKNHQLKHFDKWLGSRGAELNKVWQKEIADKTTKDEKYSMQYYIRNSIHHPENTLNMKYTQEELRNSIEKMRQIIHSCEQEK